MWYGLKLNFRILKVIIAKPSSARLRLEFSFVCGLERCAEIRNGNLLFIFYDSQSNKEKIEYPNESKYTHNYEMYCKNYCLPQVHSL